MASWKSLPLELRLTIMEKLVDGYGKTSAYASVCQEWQAFFEKRHFKRITLSSSRLLEFSRIVRGPRKKLVDHIVLRIELGIYECPECHKCQWPPENVSPDEDNAIFIKAIKGLFTALSTWERPTDLNRNGLKLELCPYSPSDSEHIFRNYNFAHDPYSDDAADFMALSAADRMGPRFHDPNHLWENGFRRSPMGMMDNIFFFRCMTRLWGRGLSIVPPVRDTNSPFSPLDPPYSASDLLPKVEVVTAFLFRRQYYRLIHPDGMCQLFESLTGLEHILYEPQERIGPYHQDQNDKRYWHLFERSLPTTLRSLTLYEDHDKDFYPTLLWLLDDYTARVNSPALGAALARASRNLEHLSASFIIDARDFFAPFWPLKSGINLTDSWTWCNLRSLALTSRLLAPDQCVDQINDLLQAAGIAARRMPNLRIMEIWNGKDNDYGCLFRYSIDETNSLWRATITWLGTWKLEIAQWVILAWTETVRENSRSHSLRVLYEDMPIARASFSASVLCHLKLRDRILHDVSFHQIQSIGDQRTI